MSRSGVRFCLAACMLLALFIVLSVQPSFAIGNNLPNAGESQMKLVTQPANMGELLYSDNFTTRKESGWSTYSDANATRFYKDGKYHLKLLRSGWSAWSFAGQNFRDFVMEVNATQEGGPNDNDYGVVTRYADIGNYSLLLISGDGFYGFARKENGRWEAPVKWTRSSAINTGNATNALKVVSQGENLTFYANGAKLGDFTDSKPTSGDVGLWVESFTEGGVQIGFDHLKVWAIKE